MSVNCPHCSKAVENAVSAETHKEALKAKSDEVKELKTALGDSKAKLADLDTITADLAKYRKEVQKRDAEAERATAFKTAGIPDSEPVRQGFAALYASSIAGAEEGKAPTFADWLDSEDAKSHPLLSGHYGNAESKASASREVAGVAATTTKATAAKGGLVNVSKGVISGTSERGIKSPAELREFFNSPQYRAMKPAEQKQIAAELQASFSDGA
jgi:hypothetical protein